jgi:hypothetical protein
MKASDRVGQIRNNLITKLGSHGCNLVEDDLKALLELQTSVLLLEQREEAYRLREMRFREEFKRRLEEK